MQHITPSGEYRISRLSGDQLISIVGPCVAVTLYDPSRCIGGMVHVVMPDSSLGALTPSNPNAFFADTAVRFLYRKMIENGASRPRLVAGVSGGASSGEHSSGISIGEKNCAAVLSALEKIRIPVISMDIGGVSGRKVCLELNTGRVSTIPVKRKIILGDKGRPYSGSKSGAVLLELQPPSFSTAEKLIQALYAPNKKKQILHDIIGADTILTFHIFRMCNSSYYGLPGKIDAIETAQARLGENQFRRICMLAGSMRFQKATGAPDPGRLNAVSQHSKAVAVVAKALARDSCMDMAGPGFWAGHLQSAGEMSMLVCGGQGRSIHGDRLAKTVKVLSHWHIPESLVQGIVESRTGTEKEQITTPLPRLLYTAFRITEALGLAPDPNPPPGNRPRTILPLVNSLMRSHSGSRLSSKLIYDLERAGVRIPCPQPKGENHGS